jgi:hypothetical protein
MIAELKCLLGGATTEVEDVGGAGLELLLEGGLDVELDIKGGRGRQGSVGLKSGTHWMLRYAYTMSDGDPSNARIVAPKLSYCKFEYIRRKDYLK